MGSLVWKGTQSLARYEFMQSTIPSVLLDVYGQPVQSGQYNGEEVVIANHDGSVLMPQATGPPAGASAIGLPYGANDNDIYSAYVKQSPWTQFIPPVVVTPTRVQAFGNSGNGTTLTASATVTVGNLLLAFGNAKIHFPVISDSLGNAWAAIPGSYVNGAYLAVVTNGGSNTVMATATGNGTQGIALTVLEIAGANPTLPINVIQPANGFGATASVTTSMPTFPNDFAISVIYSGSGAPGTPTFTPAVSGQTNETTRGGTLPFPVWVAVSDGTMTKAATQTVTATVPTGQWAIQCLLIQGHP